MEKGKYDQNIIGKYCNIVQKAKELKYGLKYEPCYTHSQNPFASTAWKVSKYGVFSGPYFSVFNPNTGKYRLEKTTYLDAFQAVKI